MQPTRVSAILSLAHAYQTTPTHTLRRTPALSFYYSTTAHSSTNYYRIVRAESAATKYCPFDVGKALRVARVPHTYTCRCMPLAAAALSCVACCQSKSVKREEGLG